jgi:hypothetical protein
VTILPDEIGSQHGSRRQAAQAGHLEVIEIGEVAGGSPAAIRGVPRQERGMYERPVPGPLGQRPPLLGVASAPDAAEVAA